MRRPALVLFAGRQVGGQEGQRILWWTELDQHRDEIVRQLKENRVTTVWGRMHNDDKVIHCSLSTFRRYVQASIPQEVDPGRVAVHGVECAPGELAEVDFGKLGRVPDPATGKPRTLWAFILVLVYSRHLFVAPVLRLDQETWLRCHLMALDFFAGRMRRIVLDNLKALRLGGMLDTLEMRLQQAQEGQGGYLEFLESLIEDEITRRDNKALTLRIQRAHFDTVCTLAEFDFTYNPKIPAPQIRDLARGGYITANQSIIICGPVGVGKSHIAQALGHAACQQGHTVLYAKTNRLLTDLGGGRADGTAEARLRRYMQPDLLIADDYGMRAFTEQQTEDLWELIGERRHSLIVVSNRAPQDWYPLFPNPVLAESVLDRLINSAHHLVLTGRSYRPLHRPDRSRAPDPVTSDASADTEEATGS